MKSILLTLLLTQIVYADDDRLGVGTHFSQNWDPNAVMPLISGCGAGWIRDDVGWPDIERQKGVYSIPAKVKNWINVANRYGLKICIVFTYANKIYADPYDPVAYSKAVAWLAQALAGKVQAIEILNEPNNDFLGYSSGAWNGKQSDGSVAPWVAKYTTLLNLSVKAIKAVNPQMTVIGLGGAETPAAYRIIAQGIDPGVDALSDHPYQASNVPEFIHYSKRTIGRDGIAVADDLGTFASYVVMWRQQAAKYGASQKIWHTEWGDSTYQAGDNSWRVTEEHQAASLARRLIESHGLAVEHTFIYVFKDETDNPYSNYDNYGIVHNKLTPKKSYFAVGRVTAALAGTIASSNLPSTLNVPNGFDWTNYHRWGFDSPDGAKSVVAFWFGVLFDGSTARAQVTVQWRHPNASKVSLYNPLTDAQTPVKWRNSGDSNTVAAEVQVTAAPQMLIIQ